jgi:8-oxo-dGTP diphosphatase
MSKVAVGIISRIRQNGQYEYLLVKSKNYFGKYTDFYYPPGGHIKENENLTDGLVREIKEELGLNIRPIKELEMGQGDVKNQETHWWLCEVISGTLQIQYEEIADAAYFTEEEINKLKIWPATKQFFDKYIFK